MAYQKQNKSDNRRIWKKLHVDPEDGEMIYQVMSLKIKHKNLHHPIIMGSVMAAEKMVDDFYRKNPKILITI